MKLSRPIVGIFVLALTFVSCAQTNGRDIPEPYASNIAKLRQDRIDLTRKCSDLQKQMAEVQNQINWDSQQINVEAGEAMYSLHYSPVKYSVNIDTMKIESSPH